MEEATALFRLPRAGTCRIAGSIVQDQFDVHTPWHTHDVHQLQYAFEGALEVEDSAHRVLLPRQLAAWIPAGVAHRTTLHRVRSMSVMFSPALMPKASERLKLIFVPALLREMIVESARWPIEGHVDAKGKIFFRAFAMLLEEWLKHEAPLSLPTSNDPQLNAAMAYTRANLISGSISEAGRTAHTSVRTLRRRFQSAGISWDTYRRRARLLAAVELLDETSLSVVKIAARVGYDNQGAFSKAFHDLLGATPSEFRKRPRTSHGLKPREALHKRLRVQC